MTTSISSKDNKTAAVELINSARGKHLMSKALYYGIQEIDNRPEIEKEYSNMDDMKYIYLKIFPSYKNKRFTLMKGGKNDSFKKAAEFAGNLRGLYIMAQALFLAMNELKAMNDPKEAEDIEQMQFLLQNIFSSFYQSFKITEASKDFIKQNPQMQQEKDLTKVDRALNEFLSKRMAA